MTYKKDLELDARLVHAAMRGLFARFVVGMGTMTTSEAFGRAEWLKRQSDAYVQLVTDRVIELENIEVIQS